MEEKINKERRIFVFVIAAIFVIFLVGMTYAFFNYTRVGTANNIRTGRIYFNTSQNGTLNLTNLFPVSSSQAGNANLDSITVRIEGDTTYVDGEEFEISLVSVNNTIVSGSTEKTIPIGYIASYEATPVATGETANNIGTSSNDYFADRGSTTAVYKLNTTGSVNEGEQVLVGFIPKDVAIDGTLIIKAYLDGDNLAISDTYPEGDVTHTESSGETSVEVVDYTNGTTEEWVNGRTVLTTEEWNSFQNTPISFKVRAESNEGTWVEAPPEPICKRVTNVASLHTETCTNSTASLFCQADGYALDGIITYGNAKSLESGLAVGDAFDCDVNGDGNYTERFYYVSPYYNTDTLEFDDTTGYATLIYYSNTIGGTASTSGSAYYASAQENWHGPVTAKSNLPTTQEWNNISLKTTSRTILAEDNSTHNLLTINNGSNTIENPFSYEGYSARLLTAQELMNGCGLTQVGNFTVELSNCKFLFERTMYADSSNATNGPWLETPHALYSDSVWYVDAFVRSVGRNNVSSTNNGARPVIDVPYSRLEY